MGAKQATDTTASCQENEMVGAGGTQVLETGCLCHRILHGLKLSPVLHAVFVCNGGDG